MHEKEEDLKLKKICAFLTKSKSVEGECIILILRVVASRKLKKKQVC